MIESIYLFYWNHTQWYSNNTFEKYNSLIYNKNT